MDTTTMDKPKRKRRTRPDASHCRPYSVGERLGVGDLAENDIVIVWEASNDDINVCKYLGKWDNEALPLLNGHKFQYVCPFTLSDQRTKHNSYLRFSLSPDDVVFDAIREEDYPTAEAYAKVKPYSDAARSLYALATSPLPIDGHDRDCYLGEAEDVDTALADAERQTKALDVLLSLVRNLDTDPHALTDAKNYLGRFGYCV